MGQVRISCKMAEFWHCPCQEVVAKAAELLLEFTETVLNPKTAAVKTNDCFRGQLKAGADKDALCAIVFYEHKTKHLVQSFTPKQIDIPVLYLCLLPV